MTDYIRVARQCLETIIEYGKDCYGRMHSPIWVGTLNTKTLKVPHFDLRRVDDIEVYEILRKARLTSFLDGSGMYSSKIPEVDGRRAIRVSQRGAGCANLYYDQPMIRAARRLADNTPCDSVTRAVQDYIQYYLKHFVDAQTGLIEWGWHIDYDVYEDAVVFPDGHHHEIHIIMPDWPTLYQYAPEVNTQEIEQIWYWHVDPVAGTFGRHPERGRGCSFAMSGGEFALAFAFMYAATGSGSYLDRAHQLARMHWEQRHPETNLIPSRVREAGGVDHFDFHTSDTSMPALWATRVLLGGALADSSELSEWGKEELMAWARYGWDGAAERPYGQLNLDGSPVDIPKATEGYDKQRPAKHLNLWAEYVMGYEYPFRSALAFIIGYHYTREPSLLQAALRYARCYSTELPANQGKGTFAQGYGQLISLFTYLSELTGETAFLTAAKEVADDAIDKLWMGRLFRGYPRKDWYESVDGPGYLVQGLCELDQALSGKSVLAEMEPFDWNL